MPDTAVLPWSTAAAAAAASTATATDPAPSKAMGQAVSHAVRVMLQAARRDSFVLGADMVQQRFTVALRPTATAAAQLRACLAVSFAAKHMASAMSGRGSGCPDLATVSQACAAGHAQAARIPFEEFEGALKARGWTLTHALLRAGTVRWESVGGGGGDGTKAHSM